MFRIIVVSAYQVGGNKALILFMALMLGFPSFAPVSMGVFVDAQETTPNQKASLPNPYDFIVKGVKQNNYLLSLLELQARETEYLASPMKEIYLDYMSYITSYIGDHEAAYKYEERLLESLAPRNKLRESYAKDISSSPIDSYQPRNALEAISSIAGSQQVIMINEEHRTPLHRAFTLRLLPMLYAKRPVIRQSKEHPKNSAIFATSSNLPTLGRFRILIIILVKIMTPSWTPSHSIIPSLH